MAQPTRVNLRGRLFSYQLYPSCGAKPAPEPIFPNSIILAAGEQTSLQQLLGSAGKKWKRCAPTDPAKRLTDFATLC